MEIAVLVSRIMMEVLLNNIVSDYCTGVVGDLRKQKSKGEGDKE